MKNNKTQPFNPFKDLVLDNYEKEIEDGLDVNTKLTPLSKPQSSKLQAMAQKTLESTKKNKNINLRISEATYLNLKAKARKLGLPYQTLASSILHQFSSK